MTQNPFAHSLIRELETSMSPGASSVIEPGPPPLDNPLSQPLDAAFGAPSPSLRAVPSPRATAAEIRGYDRAADQRQQTLTSSSLRKFGNIAKMFPGAEKVFVRRLDDQTGEWSPISEHSLRAISASGDIERFLIQHIRPKWGKGRYQVSVFDAAGREHVAGDVKLEEPVGTGGETGPDGQTTVALRLIDQLNRKIEERTPSHPQVPPADPLDTFARVNEQLEHLKGKGGDSTAIMIAMMQSQAQQTSAMLQMIAGKADPELAALKAQLAALTAAPPPMPPPMPPAPAMNPVMEQFLLAAMPMLLERLLKPELSTKDVLALVMNKGDKSELSSMKEAVAFLQSVQGNQKQASLIEELEKVQRVKDLASQLSGDAGGGSAGTTFWDALGALFQNKMFGDSLGKMLGADIEQRRAAPPPQPAPRLPAPVMVPPAQSQPVPPAQSQPAPRAEPQVFLPPEIRNHCANMEAADTDERRIEVATQTLYYLRGFPQWSAFVDELLGHAVANEKEDAVKGLRGWLGLLLSRGLIEQAAAFRVVASFDTQWPSFHTVIRKIMGLPEMAANATPAAAEPVIVPPPPVGDDEEDEGDEDEGDEDEGDEDE